LDGFVVPGFLEGCCQLACLLGCLSWFAVVYVFYVLKLTAWERGKMRGCDG
jgi:hypothetical protein